MGDSGARGWDISQVREACQHRDLTLESGQSARQWWHMLLIPVLGKQRQVDLCEFLASQGYTETLPKKKKKKEVGNFESRTLPKALSLTTQRQPESHPFSAQSPVTELPPALDCAFLTSPEWPERILLEVVWVQKCTPLQS